MENQPGDITSAALEAIAEASQVAVSDQHSDETAEQVPRERGPRSWSTSGLKHARPAKGIRKLGAAIGDSARRGANVTGRGVAAGGRWLATQVLEMAPRIPVRNLAALRAQFPGRTPDQVADLLIDGAARASAAVGVAVGTWAVLPVVPAAGAEIAAETLAVVGIEIKLIAELHEVYGLRAPGKVTDRMTAYVASWARRRGVGLTSGGLVLVAGSPLASQLRRRLASRASRSALALGPLLTGAAAGALVNRQETRKLGRMIRSDLRQRSPHAAGWPAEPAPETLTAQNPAGLAGQPPLAAEGLAGS